MKLFKRKERRKKGRGEKIQGFLGVCFKMLSPCFAPAEKLECKLAWVPYGYLLSVPVLATSEQKAWNSFDSLSSPLLPICCFTLDHEVCQPPFAGSEIKQRLFCKCWQVSETPLICIICNVPDISQGSMQTEYGAALGASALVWVSFWEKKPGLASKAIRALVFFAAGTSLKSVLGLKLCNQCYVIFSSICHSRSNVN